MGLCLMLLTPTFASHWQQQRKRLALCCLILLIHILEWVVILCLPVLLCLCVLYFGLDSQVAESDAHSRVSFMD